MTTSLQLFEELAAATWDRIECSILFDVSQGEETITDNLLLEIKRARTSSIRKVKKCPKHLEARRGIDWEWWIGSSRYGWIKYVVQAKKLSLISNAKGYYDSLNHIVKGTGKTQVSILETYARKKRVPLYCFYNFIQLPQLWFLDSYYWHCTNAANPKTNLSLHKQLGCTVTPLAVVKRAVSKRYSPSKRTFDSIHSDKKTLPWRCLLECQPIMEIYLKNYRLNRKAFAASGRPKPPRSNVISTDLFGDVAVFNTEVDVFDAEVDKEFDVESEARRLLVIDIEEQIETFAATQSGRNLLSQPEF